MKVNESWCVGLGQKGVVRGWGKLPNTLKGRETEKRGGETKISKINSKIKN